MNRKKKIIRRYFLRNDADGRSTIIDIFTGEPAVVDGKLLPRITTKKSTELVDLLNILNHAKISTSR